MLLNVVFLGQLESFIYFIPECKTFVSENNHVDNVSNINDAEERWRPKSTERLELERAQSCDKSHKTPDVKIEKNRQMWQNTICQNWTKQNTVASYYFHNLISGWKNKRSVSCSALNSNTLELEDKLGRVSCSVIVGGVSWRKPSVFYLDSHLKTASDSIITQLYRS